MKSFALLTLVSVASAAVQLFIQSDNNAVNGQGIYSTHEGAATNYFFAGTNAQSLDYDSSAKTLGNKDDVQTFVSLESNILILGVSEPAKVDLSSGFLSIDGSEDFTACLNINDPYQYSKSQYAITRYSSNAPEGCIPIKLRVVQTGGSSSSVATSSKAPAPYYSNTTTVGITVTDYTTYCPEHTTITITTCSQHKCAPTTITVESASTVTVTGECLVPSGTTSVPPAVTTSEVTVHSNIVSKTTPASVSPKSTSASVSPKSTPVPVSASDNGANKLVGLGGLAAMCALLL